MFSGTIGGIPILWIMMAQSANARRKKEKRKVANAYKLGLGDFVIDLVSQQWCRVEKVERVWTEMPELESGSSPRAEEKKQQIRLRHHRANKPLPQHKEHYRERLERLMDTRRPGAPKMVEANYISHKVKLLFADGKQVTRSVGCDDEFICVRAPEIFSFEFEQLKELTKNTQRGAKKTKKKATKKKTSRKKKAA